MASPITLVVSVVIFLGCSYWIFKNVKLEDLIGQTDIGEVSENVESKEPAVEYNPGTVYEIQGTDIVEVKPEGNTSVIVRGGDINGIESISDLKVSPDGKKLCFLVKTMVPVWLYVYDFDESKLNKIDTGKNCYWSPDSRYIAYNNHTTDVSPIDVLIFDTNSLEIKNLTENIISTDRFIQCNNISWIDGENVSAVCREISMYDVSAESNQSMYTFNVKTGDFTHP